MEKKKKIRKGDFGYISSQKKKRTMYTILAFIAPGRQSSPQCSRAAPGKEHGKS